VSQQNDDFISFEKALRDLQMQSEELKKLVSEGEIRAFRDGDSMKFRREDLDALRKGDDEIVFEETLEDDAGMVTEELSEEDTLLADDDEDVAPAPTRARPAAAPASPSRSRAAAAVEESTKEPAWAIASAILTAAVMLYGFMVIYTVTSGNAPAGLTSMWAPKG
jgi:excisionase family DNA binding protein